MASGASVSVCFAHLPGEVDRMRADDDHEVEGGGHHRLQQAVGDRRGLVLLPARLHLRDRRGRRAAPGAQVCGDAIGAEQLSIVDQVDHYLCGRPPRGWTALTDARAVVVSYVSAVGEVSRST
jgi:hypothetical protein